MTAAIVFFKLRAQNRVYRSYQLQCE